MELLLKILGGIFLGILLLITLLIVTFRFVLPLLLKRFANKLSEGFEGMAEALTLQSQPETIELTRLIAPTWNDAGKLERESGALEEAGFTPAGAFQIEPQSLGVRLNAFAHETDGIYAVIYEHEQAGIWTDLVIPFADGQRLTLTNAPLGEGMESPPWGGKISDKSANTAALIQRAQEELKERPRLPVAAAEFPQNFIQEYARDMAWRKERGGVPSVELESMAEEQGWTDDEREFARAAQRLHEDGLASFDDAMAHIEAHGIGETVRRYNQVMRYLGSVTTPVAADLWAYPED